MPRRPVMFLTNLVVLFCTALIFCIKAASAGSYIAPADSPIGQHKLVYGRRLADLRAAHFDTRKSFFSLVIFTSKVAVVLET